LSHGSISLDLKGDVTLTGFEVLAFSMAFALCEAIHHVSFSESVYGGMLSEKSDQVLMGDSRSGGRRRHAACDGDLSGGGRWFSKIERILRLTLSKVVFTT
jgi:hypothetical protein